MVNDGTANRITYTPSSLSATNWTTIGTISNVTYDAGDQYTFTATLRDKLLTATATAVLATSKMPLSLYDDNGTVGASVGQMASDEEANKFNVYLHTTFKKLVQGGDYSKTVLANITQAEVTEKAGGTAPSTTQDYLKFMLMCICDKYVGYTNTVFRGYGSRASKFYYEVFIYNTSERADDGLPRYSFGFARQYNGAFNSDFGTRSSASGGVVTTTFWAEPKLGWSDATMGQLQNYQWAVGWNATTEDTDLWVGNGNTPTIHSGRCSFRLSNKKAQPIFTLSADGVWGLFDNTPTNTTNGTTNDYKYLIGKIADTKVPFVNIRKETAYTDANDIMPPEGAYYNGSMTMGKLGSSGANNPLSGYTQTILGYRYDASAGFQIAFAISAYPIVHMRTLRNGTWQAWRLISGTLGDENNKITRSSGATLNRSTVRRNGSTVTLYLRITDTTNSYSQGTTVFSGTLASGYRPPYPVSFTSFNGTRPMVMTIGTDGAVTIKNQGVSGTIPALDFTATYVI